MSARFLADLETEQARCERLASGYRLAGERHLAMLAGLAAQASRAALRALVEFEAATGEAREREREA